MKWLDSNRSRSIILALASALLLSACSAVKLGYSTLPQLTVWWLDTYIDLTDEQEPRVRDEVAALHAWHRQNELPRVIDLLARMEQLAAGEISPQQACGVLGEAQARMKAVALQVEPTAIAFAATLAPRQLRHLARKYRSNNDRVQREWIALDPAEQLDKRYKEMLERLETVYGTLDAPQRAVLKQRLASTVWDPRKMLAQRQRRQQDLVAILGKLREGNLPAAERSALVRGWFDRLEKPSDPAYRAYQDAVLQEGCATFSAVHQSTTPAQRTQAERRLRAWQRDLRELVIAQ